MTDRSRALFSQLDLFVPIVTRIQLVVIEEVDKVSLSRLQCAITRELEDSNSLYHLK